MILVSGCKNSGSDSIIKEISFTIPEGYALEELYHPSDQGQGSWVSLAKGPGKTIYACDQRGKIYFFQSPDLDKTISANAVDSVELEIGNAHGLLWAHNSLYVAVNKAWDSNNEKEKAYGSGVYRLKDSNGDGKLNEASLLLKLEGAGEHGPHSIIPSPDGEMLYFIAGNHVTIPEILRKNSRIPDIWDEDNLFEPYLDARGHATEIKAPGGWIARFNPDGTNWELISVGYRNPFDMAFNREGELFAYDADMEWDMGMPWYRPTRICHVTSGSEYGWRTGTGKWPSYYPDNLPSVIDLQQGSPTAVLSADQLNFSKEYTDGLLVADWSFGTMYFVNLKPNGSSYTATRKEFLAGVPLPLTDMIAGNDGHLYFSTGGRGLDSRFYRLRYEGDHKQKKSIKPVDEAVALRNLRQNIEAHHRNPSPDGIALAWEHLDHQDRFIRYASRIVLEKESTDSWISLFQKSSSPDKIIQGALALARLQQSPQMPGILKKLKSLEWPSLNSRQKLDLLRAYSLTFIRLGKPKAAEAKSITAGLSEHFPTGTNALDRELAQLLLFLDAESIVEQLVDLMETHTQAKKTDENEILVDEVTYRSEQYGPQIREMLANMPPVEAIYYGVLLSRADKGWTIALHERYFSWFYEVLSAKGGMSFKPYMENIRLAAMGFVPEEQQAYFEELSGVYSPNTVIAELPQPIGPGKNYSGADINNILWGGGMDNYEGSVADGKRAYDAALCVTCHRMKGEGGATGPDLSQIHTKFSSYDLLYAIYSPNDDISDQYAFTLYTLKNGKKIAGRLLSQEGDSLSIMPNPLNSQYILQLSKDEIEETGLSPISPMPSGLLNRLNEQEVADLFAYMISGGDGNHEIYNP